MNNIIILSLVLIALGALVMLVSIVKYVLTIQGIEALLEDRKKTIYRLHKIHLSLMCFFFIGYLAVLICFVFNIHVVGILFTAVVFFFGAIFVFIGILLQAYMLVSIKKRHEKIISKNIQLTQVENVTIFALAYEAEMRDEETGKHLERTSQYVKALAEELSRSPRYNSQLTHAYIENLVTVAPVHDIGKVGIPDHILRKPGKLTDEEFKIIKKHCELGAEILRAAEEKLEFESFFTIAIEIVMSHHERWDGGGYPQGLLGEEIPLSARIMSLADVYDALRSKRCYKEAISHEESCRILKAERGKQFAPDIIDAFMRVEKKFSQISNTMAD
ncbi:HD-GYP domain-containing protein [Desulfotalea psychrophila]|uniref:Probable sensory transduction system regulatory protein n=1 Tax=Desulfotalea psychrophila (strain LSv54 / DSM 12343) TaxID=177439 RepID=Q6ALM6_DESPS|nr:HD domain-containing phosphohydrolase [Desulfotalea psychrophila]CAG36749.1 probable sensory transduction system regulatory protein [Desulfotalea psychrophila LSv54]